MTEATMTQPTTSEAPVTVPAEDTRRAVLLEVRREAVVRPKSLNAEARTVELTFTTETPVERYGFRPDDSIGLWREELSLDAKAVDLARLNGGAPLLDTHNNWGLADVIGVVEEARLDGKVGVARVRFSERAEVEPIWRDVQSGIIRNVSVGYRVQEWQSVGSDDETPRFRATRWTPYEISLVPIPADAGARVRAAGVTSSPKQADRSAATEDTTMADKAVVDPAADGAAVNKTTPPPVDVDAVRAEATRSERKRIDDIREFEKRLGSEFVAKHVDAGTAIETVRAEALKLIMAKDDESPTSGVRADVLDDGRDRFVRGASDWLMQRAGSASIGAKGKVMEPGEFRGMSLVDLARHSLELSGVTTRGLDRNEMVGQALSFRSNLNQTTGDFSVLLANVMHKVLLGAYQLAPMTWPLWCRTGSVTDFRAHNRYRLGSIGNLLTVPEGDEIKFKPIPDGEKQSISATTKGIRVAVTRQMIINDDMAAFNAIPTQLGQAAARSIEAAAYALLAENSGLGPTMDDAVVFFDAAHNNVGTGSAYSMAAIDADRQVMASQMDPEGLDYLDLRPSVVLVSLALGGTAREINTNEYDPADNKFRRRNDVRGLFSAVVDTPRLTGNRRYMFADPSIAAAFEVAFLEGQQSPMLESQPGWSTLGQEWRIVHDWGVGALDWRAAVTNIGTGG